MVQQDSAKSKLLHDAEALYEMQLASAASANKKKAQPTNPGYVMEEKYRKMMNWFVVVLLVLLYTIFYLSMCVYEKNKDIRFLKNEIEKHGYIN